MLGGVKNVHKVFLHLKKKSIFQPMIIAKKQEKQLMESHVGQMKFVSIQIQAIPVSAQSVSNDRIQEENAKVS